MQAYLAALNNVAKLALMRPVKVSVDLTELRENAPANFLFEFLHRHKVVVPALHLSRTRSSRGVADTELEDVRVLGEQLGDDGSLRLSSDYFSRA